MSEATSGLEERLARHRKLQNGMALILGKLRHNAKSITTEDARSLADNAEAGDEWTADIIAAVADIAIRNEKGDKPSNNHHHKSTGFASQYKLNMSQDVFEGLRRDPSSITEEDDCDFSENIGTRDARSTRLVSAVESLAAAHDDIHGRNGHLERNCHPSLLTVVKDLYAAVETNPEDVNAEVLRTTQIIVSKMQKAVGRINSPHPELEAELQQQYAKIVPKVKHGIVAKAEADYLHSLEARAHSHTERGGWTAIAQSVATRREQQASISSSSGNIRPCANSRTFTPHKQPHYETAMDHYKAELESPRFQKNAATADALHLTEQGFSEKEGVTPSNASIRRLQSLSESTNTTRSDSRYDTAFFKLQANVSGNMGSGGLENTPHAHKRENSHSPA